jgi:hypothetical protein
MKEADIYTHLTTWLRYQHPNLIWRWDFAAGTKLSIGQAVKMKALQDGSAYPDFFLAKPVGKYSGLYLEIKKEGFDLFQKRNPIAFANQHIANQNDCLKKLQEAGYYAEFAIGEDECIKIITMYLNNQL